MAEKMFAIKPERCSASNRNAVRDHRNAVWLPFGILFGFAGIHIRNSIVDEVREKEAGPVSIQGLGNGHTTPSKCVQASVFLALAALRK